MLGRSADPVPGDPGVVQHGGEQYLEVAAAIGRTVTHLRGLDAGTVHVSEAVDAFIESAREVADQIARAQERYRDTGNALTAYAPQLATAQERTLEAWQLASSAQADQEAAERDRVYYLSLAGESTDPEQGIRYENLADDAGQTATEAAGRIALALEQTADAVALRDASAEEAIAQIRAITGSDGLEDGWWESWGSDVLSVITDVAGWVATVAGVLALAVAWIPVVGQVLSAALLLTAGVAAVVNAIGNTVLAATGERSWTEAGISILGAALAVVGLGAAARVVGNAAAATRINARAAMQPGFVDEALTMREAISLRPSVMRRSESLWNAPLPTPAAGDDVFRLAGGDSPRIGQSWGSIDPRTMGGRHPELLGLPKGNLSEELVFARVVDPDRVTSVRHALPLDGNPGGAPEYFIRTPDLPAGITVLGDVPFRVP